ncbi:hypothetical protein B566_EDAN018619, partial [Ephemera danica]
ITTFNDEDDRIIGGTAAQNYQFPWQVSITFACFLLVHVRSENVNSLDVDPSTSGIEAACSVLHPNNETDIDEFAGITSRDEDYRIIGGTAARNNQFPWQVSILAINNQGSCGGSIIAPRGRGSAILNYVDVPVISNEECNNDYKAIGLNIYNTMICTSARNGTTTTCQGDSGGALIYKESSGVWTQIGIVSFGLSKCQQEQSSVYTRVTSYLRWISNLTNIRIRR